MRYADCHPDQKHYCKGLCSACYNKQRDRKPYQRLRYAENRNGHADKAKDWAKVNRWGAQEINVEEAKNALLTSDSCVLCDSQDRLVLDHDHKTSKVRGVLCANCNSGIGFLGDDPNRLQRAIAYLGFTLLKSADSFDDVLLKPQLGIVESRDDVDTSTIIGGIPFKVPIWASPMETVTEWTMAQAMHEVGGLGVVHRFMPLLQQSVILNALPSPRAIAIGLKDGMERSELDADILVLDIAHAHHVNAIKLVTQLRFKHGDRKVIVAGSVATFDGAEALFEAGADAVRVGIGSGAACSTRLQTGVGVSQLTAITQCAKSARKHGGQVISDGGIRHSGDIVKALAAGADAVMIGSLLAGAPESPMPGRYFGEASRDAKNHTQYIEGESGTVPLTDSATMVIERLMAGVRSGIAYCGGTDIQSLRNNAKFYKVSPATQIESAVRVTVD